MRIGIITHPLSYNYGGLLQNYALQKVLKRMGHDPITLNPDMHKKVNVFKWVQSFPKRLLIKYYLGYRNLRLFTDLYPNYNWRKIMKNLQPFIDEYIKYINIKDFDSLSKSDFDALVAGSDQIWRPSYVRPIERGYLVFAKHWKVKRIAYAASFGTDEWEYSEEQTRNCKELVELFDGISVRECSGIELCKKYFDVDAELVLDPTMLLTSSDYISVFMRKNTPKSCGTLLNYILDESSEKTSLVNKIAEERGLIPFRVNGNPELGYTLKERIQPSMESWLRGFYDAEYIVTDSFHACVFAIIFNKPFVAWGNKERGSARFRSLLRIFELEDRLLFSLEDFSKINDKIDWTRINKKIDAMRSISLNFLNSFLVKDNVQSYMV